LDSGLLNNQAVHFHNQFPSPALFVGEGLGVRVILRPFMLKCLYDVDTGVSAMNTHVQRWGNSLAVRIPKAFAEEAGLQANDEIEITVRDGQIVLTPRKAKTYSLDNLLAGVTDENRPGEWDMGPAVGNEVW
jgi:antitoxin MazE